MGICFVAAILLVFFLLSNFSCEAFTPSPLAEKISAESKVVFAGFQAAKTPPKYEIYKEQVTNADPVQFFDTYDMWRHGALNAKNVDNKIL